MKSVLMFLGLFAFLIALISPTPEVMAQEDWGEVGQKYSLMLDEPTRWYILKGPCDFDHGIKCLIENVPIRVAFDFANAQVNALLTECEDNRDMTLRDWYWYPDQSPKLEAVREIEESNGISSLKCAKALFRLTQAERWDLTLKNLVNELRFGYLDSSLNFKTQHCGNDSKTRPIFCEGGDFSIVTEEGTVFETRADMHSWYFPSARVGEAYYRCLFGDSWFRSVVVHTKDLDDFLKGDQNLLWWGTNPPTRTLVDSCAKVITFGDEKSIEVGRTFHKELSDLGSPGSGVEISYRENNHTKKVLMVKVGYTTFYEKEVGFDLDEPLLVKVTGREKSLYLKLSFEKGQIRINEAKIVRSGRIGIEPVHLKVYVDYDGTGPVILPVTDRGR